MRPNAGETSLSKSEATPLVADLARFAMLPLAAIPDSRLTFRTLKVLAAICSFRTSAEDFCVHPGRQEISSRCGLTVQAVSTATTELARLGWLKKIGQGGRGLNTGYLITIPETVSDSKTVSEVETVSESATKTVSDSGTLLYRKEVNRQMGGKAGAANRRSFDAFWKAYPIKIAKSSAMSAWDKVNPTGVVLANLMAALELQKGSAQWIKDHGQYIPHPANWLNQCRWEDETPYASTASVPATTQPKPGDRRIRCGAEETFTDNMGWIPACS